MRKLLLSVGLAAFAGLALIAGTSGAFADSSANWQLISGTTKAATPNLAGFNFTVQDKTRLLFNGKDAALLGPDYGKTMTATFTVANVTGAFTYGGEPSCGGTTGNVRLYFESIPPGAKFAYTNYWWSDTASAVLANDTLTVSAPIDAAKQWGDWNGQTTTGNPGVDPAFISAANNITAVGLSFGGGCFFENGVGTTDGSGNFTLNSFTVS